MPLPNWNLITNGLAQLRAALRDKKQELCPQGERILRMPPVKESNAMHWVQDDLHTLFTAQFPTTMDRRILEHQSYAMMPHVRAHIDSKLGGKNKFSTQIKQPCFPTAHSEIRQSGQNLHWLRHKMKFLHI